MKYLTLIFFIINCINNNIDKNNIDKNKIIYSIELDIESPYIISVKNLLERTKEYTGYFQKSLKDEKFHEIFIKKEIKNPQESLEDKKFYISVIRKEIRNLLASRGSYIRTLGEDKVEEQLEKKDFEELGKLIKYFVDKNIIPIYFRMIYNNECFNEKTYNDLFSFLTTSEFIKKWINGKRFLSDILVDFNTKKVFFINKDSEGNYKNIKYAGTVIDDKNFIFNLGFSRNEFKDGKFSVWQKTIPLKDITNEKLAKLYDIMK